SGDDLRIEPGAFEQDIGSFVIDTRALAADDAAEADGAALVGDHAIFRSGLVFLAIEREELVALATAADDDIARQLLDVIDVQGAGLVDREEVGDVDERRDGPQPNSLEPLLKPAGAGPVSDAADQAAPEDVTARVSLNDHLGLCLAEPFDGLVAFGLEPADAGRCQV